MPNGPPLEWADFSDAPVIRCSELISVDLIGPEVCFTLIKNQPRSRAIAGRVILPVRAVLPGIELTIHRIGSEIGARVLRKIA